MNGFRWVTKLVELRAPNYLRLNLTVRYVQEWCTAVDIII